ncbi:uncharacterized protein Triagg1_5055 [Trichoderma aggressivum f. europaeum]|uniref:Uncharacterized protein n=1 Tax=Trichoderma aggressivum f. europaeum TaxID=173218 RepID=A0AAE1JA03_9HYPO|nr:hypothetical protein Triagg1_5055 [Trichoderma aggressivum f. europaeum]
MSHGLDNLTGLATEGIGLRFLNEEWNDSISNGHPFAIQWNESLDGTQAPELGLFKITYPKDGVIAYELVSNLTGSMNNENATCLWTPSHLDDELYTLWLSSSRDARSNWTASPPWRLKETPRHSLHWAAPVVIPIIVLLAVYTLGLTTCIVYRRRRKARREREKSKGKDLEKDRSSQTRLLEDAERHPSVDTILTIQSLDDTDEVRKPNIWLLTQSASGSLLLSSPSRKNSDATLVSTTTQASDQVLISPISFSEQSLQSLQSPISIASDRTLVTLSDPRDQKAVIAGRLGRSVRVIIPSDDVRVQE